MKILAFGASYSKHSINKQFAGFVANRFQNHEVEILDLNDFPLPVFTVDLEKESGYPEPVLRFIDKIRSADFLIISMAEHNGNFTAGFKNIFDWSSRVNGKIFEGKSILLLSTSPGRRGGVGSLEIAAGRFPFHGASIAGKFSLPSFNENFDAQTGIKDEVLKMQLHKIIGNLKLN